MPPSRQPRSILATLPVLIGLVVVVTAVLIGVLGPLERGVQRQLSGLWPDSTLQARAVLVEVDAEAVDLYGPLPWTQAQWQDVAVSLRAAGVEEVAVVEPADRLVRAASGDAPVAPAGSAARLQLVQAPWAMSTSAVVAPFTPSSLTVDLPMTRGVVEGLGSDAVGSAWCEWARCGQGDALSTPLRGAEAQALPRIPLGALLSGEVRTVVPEGSVVLLGITDPRWAHPVAVGVDGVILTWGEAIGLGVATLASRSPRWGLHLGVLLPLCALLVLIGALVANAEPWIPAEAWLAALPAFVSVIALLLLLFGVIELPLVPLVAAAVVGPLAEILRLRSRTARFIRRMSLQLARADVGLPQRVEGGTDADSVLRRLSALTWNHLPTDRMLYVEAPVGSKPRVIGGFGLSEQDLRTDQMTEAGLQRLASQGRCDELVDRSTVCASIVPVHQGTVRLGFWIVAWIDGDLAPALATLKELARWNDEQSASNGAAGGSFGWLLRMDRELDAISSALARNTQARSRQGQLLEEMDLPMAFADRAGRFVFKNSSFKAAFDLFDEEVPGSVRQLVHSRSGADDLSRRMRRVFVSGETLRVDWPEVGRVVCVTGVGGQIPTGVVVWIEHGTQRRAQSTVGGTCPVQALKALVSSGRIEMVSPVDVPTVMADPEDLRRGIEDLLEMGARADSSSATPKVVFRNARAGLRVSVRWRGLTLDEAMIGAFGDGAETAELHSDLIPFARARRRFSDLRLIRGPGRGVQVVFTLPRVSLAS
ncbi:MAG: hypothetical protein AB8H79_11370 [Myxococcota bacterium]